MRNSKEPARCHRAPAPALLSLCVPRELPPREWRLVRQCPTPHGCAGLSKEPHSSHFNSRPVRLGAPDPRICDSDKDSLRTIICPFFPETCLPHRKMHKMGEGGRHKTEGPPVRDRGLQAGPGRPRPRPRYIFSQGVTAASMRLQAGRTRRSPGCSPRGDHPAPHATHTVLLHTSGHTTGARNKPGTWTPTMSKDPGYKLVR